LLISFCSLWGAAQTPEQPESSDGDQSIANTERGWIIHPGGTIKRSSKKHRPEDRPGMSFCKTLGWMGIIPLLRIITIKLERRPSPKAQNGCFFYVQHGKTYQ